MSCSMDNRLALMAGIDIPIPECQLIVHQPKIKEIALIGEKEFFIGVQCLCVDKKVYLQDESLLENTSNFQIFMTIMSEKETKDKKAAVMQLFSIIFPSYKIVLTPRSIIFNNPEGSVIIDENNFNNFQEILKEIFCFNSGNGQDTYNPADAKAKEIAEKLMRGRQRIAAEKGEDKGSALVQYTSALTIGLKSMSLNDIINLTMFQLYDLVQRYSLYISWDLDIKTRLAGGKPDSQPDNWMKNIH